MRKDARNNILHGPTYKVVIDDDMSMYVTINEQKRKPFEIFIRSDSPELYQWINLATILITRLLRAGTDLLVIAKEMQNIHSSNQSVHFTPGGTKCYSLVSRIGQVLELHTQQKAAGYGK